MCIAAPMQVVASGPWVALCHDPRSGAHERVDVRLVGEQPVGTWLLVFLGAAREVIDAERARLVGDALAALAAVAAGDPVGHLFAGLDGREPTLPEFLRPAAQGTDCPSIAPAPEAAR